MSPHRAKTYVRLFAALSLSVLANLLLLQPRLPGRGHAVGQVGPAEAHAGGHVGPSAMRLAAVAPKFAPAEASTDTVRGIQRELRDLGHYPGALDGRVSQLTQAAVFAYEQQHGQTITAEPTEALLKELILGRADGGPPAKGGPGVAPGSPADKLVGDIRQNLAALGYTPGRSDGRLSPELIKAIRAYETDNGLVPPTGRINAALVQHLQRKAASSRQRAG